MIENNSWNYRRKVTDLDGKKKGFVKNRGADLLGSFQSRDRRVR